MCEIVLLDLYFTEKASHKRRTLFQRIQIILSKEPIKQTNKQINKQTNKQTKANDVWSLFLFEVNRGTKDRKRKEELKFK